jgi:hypothetical protein
MDIRECQIETLKHISNVENILKYLSKDIIKRGKDHDKSKLESPEVEGFTKYTPKLATCTYGSDEYKEYLKGLNEALKDHYRVNRHHPEHFRNGIRDMNLIDIIELLADWKSATLRHNNGDLIKSININQDRFDYSNDLKCILLNTAKLLFKYRIEWYCCDGRSNGYYSDTLEGIRKQIDADPILDDTEKHILKYGYFDQFKDDFETSNFCIDGGFDMHWYVQDYGLKKLFS